MVSGSWGRGVDPSRDGDNMENQEMIPKRDRIRVYLAAIAAGCAEVATTPSPKMLATIRGVLKLCRGLSGKSSEKNPGHNRLEGKSRGARQHA